MSRLLLLTSKLPYPPEDGGRIATWNLSRCLRHNGYRIDLACFTSDPSIVERHAGELGEVYASVHPILKNVERQFPLDLLRALASGRSYFVRKFRTRPFERRLTELLDDEPYEATVLDTAYAAVYLPLIESHAAQAGRLILRLTNVEHEIFARLAALERRPARRFLLAREARLFKRFEMDAVRRVSDVRAITERDAALLSEASGRPIDVLDPFIDVEAFPPGSSEEIERHSVVYVGDLRWPPNRNGTLWFHREIWPQVLERFPGARSYIVGKNPPPEVRRLASSSVTVTGYVEDIRPYFRRAHLFIVPLLEGSGIRIKILMAMAMGRPVLSTSVGAEGIGFDGIVRRDRPRDWVEEIGRIFGGEARLIAEAVAHTAARYGWRRPLRLGEGTGHGRHAQIPKMRTE